MVGNTIDIRDATNNKCEPAHVVFLMPRVVERRQTRAFVITHYIEQFTLFCTRVFKNNTHLSVRIKNPSNFVGASEQIFSIFQKLNGINTNFVLTTS